MYLSTYQSTLSTVSTHYICLLKAIEQYLNIVSQYEYTYTLKGSFKK